MFWATVTGLSAGAQPRRAPRRLASAAAARAHTVLDLDYRPMFWADPAEAQRAGRPRAEHVTVAVGNREECEVAVGETDPQRAADALLDRGLELAVVKQGPRGVLAATRDERVEVPPFPVEVVNGLGAGDAFGGALCHGLLAGLGRWRVLDSRTSPARSSPPGSSARTAMPTDAEVEALLTGTAARPMCRGGCVTDRHHGPSSTGVNEIREPGDPRRIAEAGTRRTPPAAARRRRPAAASSPPTTRPAARSASAATRRRWPAGPTCSTGCRPRSPAPASTACSAPPTSSTTCCCSAPSTDKVVIGSMNRGGLQGAAFELDDRFTAYDGRGHRRAAASTAARC